MEYAGVGGHFSDRKGMRYIAMLLRSPHPPTPTSAIRMVTGGPDILPLSSQLVADQQQLEALHLELADVNREIDVAAEECRLGVSEELHHRRQRLLDQLRFLTGGKAGPKAFEDSAGTKARKAVRKCVAEVLDVFADAEPKLTALADHLRSAIRVKNAAFWYGPDGPVPEWEL